MPEELTDPGLGVDEVQATYHTPPDVAEEIERQRQQKELHYEGIYTDNDKLKKLFNDKEGQFILSRARKPEEVMERSANWSFLEHRYGQPISFTQYPQFRKDYAQKHFGKPEASDAELYGLIKGDYETGKKQREAYNSLYERVITHEIGNMLAWEKPKGTIEIFENWKEANKDILKGRDEWGTLNNGYRMLEGAKDRVAKYGDFAARGLEVMNAYRNKEAGELEIRKLAEDWASIPPEDRKEIYKMMVTVARAQDGDLSDFKEFSENMAKSVAHGFGWAGSLSSAITGKRISPGGVEFQAVPLGMGSMFIPQLIPLGHIEGAAQVAIDRALRMKPGPARDAALAEANHQMETVKVVNELHDTAFSKIDPVEPLFERGTVLGTLERGAYGIAGSMGWMATAAASPVLGGLAIYQDEYKRWRTEFPGMNPYAAQAGAGISASIQGVIEKFQVDAMLGKLPFFSAYTSRVTSRLGRALGAIGISATTQNVQEFVQDAISEFAPGLVSALDHDAPNFDWKAHFDEYWNSRPEVFTAATVFGLIGAGSVDLADLRDPQDIINDRMMQYAGLNVMARERIFRAEDRQEQLQIEYAKRKPKDIQRGKAVAEADYQAAVRSETNPETPKMEARTNEDGERVYTITRLQSGELTPAGQQKVDEYSSLIECLGR